MRILFPGTSTVAALASLGLVLTGCGDDGGGDIDTGVPIDAAVDAMVDATPTPDPAGTIAVLDLAITDPGLPFTLAGATVNVSYADTLMTDVAPVFGDPTPPLGSCSVWVYNVGQDEPLPTVDEGSVTVTGALTPVGMCTYSNDGSHVCSNGNGTLPAGALITAPNAMGLVSVFSAGSFVDANGELDLSGGRIMLSGFAELGNNGEFPVMGQDGIGNSVTILHPGAIAETLAADGTFMGIMGGGPSPANVDFLDATSEVTIEKAAGDRVPAFTVSVTSSGDGLTLSDTSTLPHALPIPAADATFSCNAANGGNCGNNGEFIVGWVVSGSTTDADIAGLQPYEMPNATTLKARFQCRGTPGATDVTLPQGAMEAILGTSPTRIETQLFRISADLGQPFTSVIVGHGFIGHTTVP